MALSAKPFAVALAMMSMVPAASAGDLPIPALTPGAFNPDVTVATLQHTACVAGWTSTIRPPSAYTDGLKTKQIDEYGYTDRNPADYEEDHLVPLALGGHPTDPGNLWPQPRTGQWNAATKDRLEFALHKAVCNGELALDEARSAMQSDWIAAYNKYINFVNKYAAPAADGPQAGPSASQGGGASGMATAPVPALTKS